MKDLSSDLICSYLRAAEATEQRKPLFLQTQDFFMSSFQGLAWTCLSFLKWSWALVLEAFWMFSFGHWLLFHSRSVPCTWSFSKERFSFVKPLHADFKWWNSVPSTLKRQLAKESILNRLFVNSCLMQKHIMCFSRWIYTTDCVIPLNRLCRFLYTGTSQMIFIIPMWQILQDSYLQWSVLLLSGVPQGSILGVIPLYMLPLAVY